MSIGEQESDKDSDDVTQGTRASSFRTEGKQERERAVKSEKTESGSEGGGGITLKMGGDGGGVATS